MIDERHPVVRGFALLQQLGTAWVRQYHRLTVDGDLTPPDQPTLFVANHGFGGIVDLNVATALAAIEDMGVDRRVTILTHQIAWTLGVGPFLEPLGSRPASPTAARDALAEGNHVLIFPGGDLDAFKSRADRDRIVFGDRCGFARLALETETPIVPIVTAGAGNTLLVLSDGQGLARRLRLDTLLRLKAAPVTLSVPWGLNVGLVGLLPYLPLPARLATRVLPAVAPHGDEDPAELADRVTAAMQTALTNLARTRTRARRSTP